MTDEEFILSLSKTSWLSFSNVKYLFEELSGNRKNREILFDLWTKKGFYPPQFIIDICNENPT